MFDFLSEDPLISSLRQFGYNVLRLPRASVKPLQVLIKKDSYFYKIGELTTLFKARSNIPLPEIKENIQVADVFGKKSGDLGLGIGLSIVGNIISAFGGSPLGLDNVCLQAKTISFAYEDMFENRIEMSELARFLNDADINPFSSQISELLESTEVYLVTSTIKTKKITVYAPLSTGTTLKDSIPTVQGIVGASLKVANTRQDPYAMTFEGSIPLVFGFQAIQLLHTGGRYGIRELASSDISMRGEPNKGKIKPITDGPFVRLITDDMERKAVPTPDHEKPAHLLLDLDEQLMEKRFEAYGELLSLLEVLAKYNPVPVKYETIRDLSKNLQEWFFRKKGDLVLSPKSYPLYHNLQREIHAISGFNDREGVLPDEDKLSITKRSSDLRASMRNDLHRSLFPIG